MTHPGPLIAKLVSLLDSSGFCDETRVVETAAFSQEQFSLRIRSQLPKSLNLQIRLYHNRGHIDYSYQVFDDAPLVRWDNKEHFPELKTFPHHFHSLGGEIIESPLTGEPVSDLETVLAELRDLLNLPA